MASAAGASTSEWFTIVEIQQQEIEELRARVTDATVSPSTLQQQQQRPGSADSVRSAFALESEQSYRSHNSNSSSSSSSSSSRIHGALPLDLQRYAKVCGDVEMLQRRLTRKELKNRELRAKTSQQTREMNHFQSECSEKERHVQLLTAQLASEQSAKQEAVERVVQTIFHNEELTVRLQEATETIDSLRVELQRVRGDITREMERRQSDATHSREMIARLEDALRLAQRELQLETTAFHVYQSEVTESHACSSSEREQELDARVSELESILERQTVQLDKQQRVIVELHDATSAITEQNQHDQLQMQHHVQHQLHANVALQHVLDQNTTQIHSLTVSLAESHECTQMQSEEIEALVAWRRLAMRRECLRDERHAHVQLALDKVDKSHRHVDTARRKALSELVETKRQLQQLHTAMHGIGGELEQMNKTFVLFRAREANVGRALREYGRRNRQLQDAVTQMSAKVHLLSTSLRRSEKRKQKVVTESHQLHRGLVVERCQRLDLLQQCHELENCLSAFQHAAFDSADRAQSVDKENAVLQHAVAQLCAYATELERSQRTLQEELTQLEVRGHVELQVFG